MPQNIKETITRKYEGITGKHIMLLSIVPTDFSIPWFPAKPLKSDFSPSFAVKIPTTEKYIYSSYFLTGNWEGRRGYLQCRAKDRLTPIVAEKKLEIIFLEDF